MSVPQEHHCDLGLIEDDRTPLLTKKATPGGNQDVAHVQTLNYQEKTVNTAIVTPTGTPAPIDTAAIARVMADCTTWGLALEVQATGEHVSYKLRSPDSEVILWTYNLATAHMAAGNWLPTPVVFGHSCARTGHTDEPNKDLRVESTRGYGDEPAFVWVQTRSNFSGQWSDDLQLTVDQALGLAELLVKAAITTKTATE